MRRAGVMLSGLGVVVLIAACSGDAAEESSTTATTTTAAPLTSLAPVSSSITTTTTSPPTTSTTTTAEPVIEFPEYTIVAREGDAGATVVILLDTESYDTLADIDLVNVLADVVDKFPPIITAYVVDSPDVTESVLLENPSEDQQALLDLHYLVRLEEGFRIVFTGPFADLPIAILGS